MPEGCFGEDPLRYANARPEYPPLVYARLAEVCALNPDTTAFEIGAGTGVATRALLARGVSRLTVVEPDRRLAAFLSESLPASDQLRILAEPFEHAALEASAFDLGVAATAFHWIEPSIGLRKVHELLSPGGWWAMWWTVFDDPERSDPFVQATAHLFARLERTPSRTNADAPHMALEVDARSTELRAARFDAIQHELIRSALTFDTAGIVDLIATFSPVTRLPDDDRLAFLDAVSQIAEHQFGGVIPRRFVTSLYIARKPLA